MKSKKLIELLQKEDPTGETEVCIGNEDIYYIENMVAYWDGCLEVLKRDETSEYYNVIGAKYTSSGYKIGLRTLSIFDALLDNQDLPVEVEDSFVKKEMQTQVNMWREEARKWKKEQFDDCLKNFLPKILQHMKDGYKVIQPKEKKIGNYNCHSFVKDKKSIHLCQGESFVIVDSKFFIPVEKENYIEWEFKL